ncbi:hypothetical protein HXZ66_11900 [Bacillus sp. A116_S68]|nr:hypothetical protein HXZ66_11900 [Bacillus sp. A116_S68]
MDEWFNTFIYKNIYGIDVFDLCKMIRQNILRDLAVNKAIDILRFNQSLLFIVLASSTL